ncbi:MupG family TIM beta-alpha barrel fold protein [Priestia flexa]|uniref:DUF871 domain-containing protein n=1 Tax=Priestia flexa TaxID=86664 RepID=A0A1N6TLQ1_9BACI|nr:MULTISPECIES: MupG family TIM beta-alpha barrel fold protein [Bacillaceae]AQX54288.1 hypothetical protein BC359_08205 [Priestia flexa]KZB90110.1 hypothetical protein A2U94_17800 [Bacillus sp. VT 712]MBN8251764.1 DUF871 domain-containing protein [Priestia flexa]MBN8434819.1 DUF871 domain-containing protein [Priestia flexa]MBY6087241.1 DUF871 family protein [Priestia flexa]
MIGISFYLNDQFAEQRIMEASKKGVKRAFTSLHIPEETGHLAQKAKHLLQVAKQHEMEVYADVSKHTPIHLQIPQLEDLVTLGVTGIRLDDGFEVEDIIYLSQFFKLAVNASTVSESFLTALVTAGIEANQLVGWHNFYPRRETGLDEVFFRQQNHMFFQQQIPVIAFVAGQKEKRGPLFEGLPTLEQHRTTNTLLAAVCLVEEGISSIYIGDPEFNEEIVNALADWNKHRILTLRMVTETLPACTYQLRPDRSRDVVRLQGTRTSQSIKPSQTIRRPRGTITMDNERYGRYQGEVHIGLNDLPADERVNVIGHIHPEDIELLELAQQAYSLRLIRE